LTPFLSIIIPAYNEENRLPTSLEKIFAYTEAQSYPIEVIVVENGSTDNTYEVARAFVPAHPSLRVIHEKGRGKGLAVRRGMLEAQGEYRFMADADLSMPIEELYKFIPAKGESYDVAIGSREAPGAKRFNEPAYRHWGGRAVNLMIRLLAIPHLRDTQCGFKSFRAEVAVELFHKQTMPGWSFDIELLYIAQQRGFQIVEIPIHWYFGAESKVNPLNDTMHMFYDIITMHRNARKGVYGPKV
jgi:glycosyltransferase involved in cell wall biosynthesis